MDPKNAWTKMFEVYTDGDNVWAMKGDQMLATERIGFDIDGADVALATAVHNVAAAATEAVAEFMLVVR
jgi:hypothetical protein